jgi:hypothetical protein
MFRIPRAQGRNRKERTHSGRPSRHARVTKRTQSARLCVVRLRRKLSAFSHPPSGRRPASYRRLSAFIGGPYGPSIERTAPPSLNASGGSGEAPHDGQACPATSAKLGLLGQRRTHAQLRPVPLIEDHGRKADYDNQSAPSLWTSFDSAGPSPSGVPQGSGKKKAPPVSGASAGLQVRISCLS